MPFIAVGVENSAPIDIYYEDHGSGQPVVLIHGFPYAGSTWEKQVGPLLAAGYRTITYDRRGFGNSSQPATGYDYDTFAADLDALLRELDLQDVILVGHSMGTGEITRYLSTYGSDRVNGAVLLSPLPPFLLKTPDNPEGLDQSVFDGFKQQIIKDRFQYVTAFGKNFFSYDENKGKRVSEEAFHAHWSIGARASAIGTLKCVDTWLTDFRPDLPRIDVPVLIIQGDHDMVLPISATGQRLPSMLPGSQFITLSGAPHGIPWTHADEVNQAIMEFISAKALVTASSR